MSFWCHPIIWADWFNWECLWLAELDPPVPVVRAVGRNWLQPAGLYAIAFCGRLKLGVSELSDVIISEDELCGAHGRPETANHAESAFPASQPARRHWRSHRKTVTASPQGMAVSRKELGFRAARPLGSPAVENESDTGRGQHQDR